MQPTKAQPIISIIVAMTRENIIAVDGVMPWTHADDMKHFYNTTKGKPIIMGRKTHEAIGQTLPGRKNIVLTRGRSGSGNGSALYVSSVEEALLSAGDVPEIMIIGGAEIYSLFMPLVTKIYVTTMHMHVSDTINATHFPSGATFTAWTMIEQVQHAASDTNSCACTISTYVCSR